MDRCRNARILFIKVLDRHFGATELSVPRTIASLGQSTLESLASDRALPFSSHVLSVDPLGWRGHLAVSKSRQGGIVAAGFGRLDF
jgi:hypothetical protein